MPAPPATPPTAAGDLVGLVEDGRALLAVVAAVHGSRADLRVGFDGRSLQRPLRLLDLLASLPGERPPPGRIDRSPWNLEPTSLRDAQPPPRELAAAWLLLSEEGGTLDLPVFTALLGDGASPLHRSACWLWLQGDQQLFRWRRQQVEARPLAELRRVRRERRRERLAEQRRRAWQEALRRRLPIDAGSLEPPERDQLRLLRAWAGGDSSEPLPEDLRRHLHAAHCHTEAGAIRHLLVDLGQWPRHHLPSLERTTWESGFPPDLRSEAARLLAEADRPQPGDEHRSDLTHLRTVTIDDDDTLDIDDGLSLENLGEGRRRLWIHVADPGRLVLPDSPLDREARRRGASLYLARGSLPMFPAELANGPFSLRATHRCPAWSVAVELDGEGAVLEPRILRSWVRPAYRLSYADADELIELAPPPEDWLAEFHGLMELRRRWRLGRGAVLLEQPEGRIRAEGEEARLEICEPSPARLLVSEAMVLAGAVIAEHGRRLELPLPYRSQLPVELPPAAELSALPSGPVRHAAIRRCLSRGHVGTTPAAHFSLALEAYAQATSPIRRYGDLLVQRQLAALAEGRPPLGTAELGELLSELEGPVRQGIQIAREDQRHWLQVWFEQQRQCQWGAVFLRWLRPQDRLGLVHAEELAMDLAAECPAGSDPGDSLLLRVLQVDSLRDQLRLQAGS